MKMADFKALSLEERLTKLNKHLLSLKTLGGRLEDNFKTGEFDFSYSLLKKNAAQLGITVDGKNYRAYYLLPHVATDIFEQENQSEQQEIVISKQNNVKQQQVVKTEELSLTTDEIRFVKELFANKQDLVKGKQTLLLPQFVGAKKTTGISVYVELWERWGNFKKAYPMYSGTNLLALALEEFMEKYDEGSDS
ncbi:MAG: hypothetical protein ABS949_20205 [Solibacillus sp.]